MTTVLVDATALPADRGGVGRYVDELVTRLPGLGAEVHVAAQERDLTRYAAVLDADHVHLAPGWASGTPARLVWEQVGLPGVVRQLRPDVLHSPHYTMPLPTRLAARLHGPLARVGRGSPTVPTAQVVTLHDATFFSLPEMHLAAKRRFFTAWTRVSASEADALIVPSVATRDEVVAHTGVDPDRIGVVPHGVDHDRFRPPTPDEVPAVRQWLGLPDGTPYVAFLGTLEPRKNVPALVAAWVSACRGRDDPPVLVLAGGRGWDDGIDAALAAVPAGLRIVRPGFVPDDLVPALLGGAEVFAYPAFGEGFGLPVLEAMACGAAVLTTRRLSLPEVGGEAVAYASSPDAADVAAALAALLDDPERRKVLGKKGIARAATYTWEATARGHLEIYDAASRCVASRCVASR